MLWQVSEFPFLCVFKTRSPFKQMPRYSGEGFSWDQITGDRFAKLSSALLLVLLPFLSSVSPYSSNSFLTGSVLGCPRSQDCPPSAPLQFPHLAFPSECLFPTQVSLLLCLAPPPPPILLCCCLS